MTMNFMENIYKSSFHSWSWPHHCGAAAAPETHSRWQKSKNPQMVVVRPDEAERQAESAKTTRLRALRLAKEAAADREAVSRKAAASAGQHGRVRAPRTPTAARDLDSGSFRRLHVEAVTGSSPSVDVLGPLLPTE